MLASLELLDRAARPPEPVLWLDAQGLRGKTLAQARERCRAAYVASETAYLTDLP